MTRSPDCSALAALLADRMPKLAMTLLGDPSHRTRDEWRYGGKGSLSVIVAGPKRGKWFNYEAGTGGDALALVKGQLALPMGDACAWSQVWLGHLVTPLQAPVLPRRAAASTERRCGGATSRTMDLARMIWREAVAPPGTLVEAYLASRGLMLPNAAAIRFHPECPRGAERWPAMVALMTDAITNDPVGVHRTFLARDGQGKAPGLMPAKMMAGKAGVIRLVPDEEVTMALGLAEGIETSLAVMQHFAWRPVWAATSAGGMAGFPVLPLCLTLFADPDGPGLAAAGACAERWAEAGCEVAILAPPAGDFTDLVAEAAGEC